MTVRAEGVVTHLHEDMVVEVDVAAIGILVDRVDGEGNTQGRIGRHYADYILGEGIGKLGILIEAHSGAVGEGMVVGIDVRIQRETAVSGEVVEANHHIGKFILERGGTYLTIPIGELLIIREIIMEIEVDGEGGTAVLTVSIEGLVDLGQNEGEVGDVGRTAGVKAVAHGILVGCLGKVVVGYYGDHVTVGFGVD
jgi:hypothetical protein